MRRVAIGALLVGTVMWAGCIDSSRVNRECRWTDVSNASLNLDRAADREHLRQDAQVAWEVGQRFADVRYRTQPEPARPLLEACRAAMWDSIIVRHHVLRDDVARAARARLWWADTITVFLPMTLLTAIVTLLITRETDRLAMHGRMRNVVSAGVVGIVALIMTGLIQIWAMSVESWRLRNEHIAGRGFVVPSVAHPVIAFIVVCAIVAAVVRTRGSRSQPHRATIS